MKTFFDAVPRPFGVIAAFGLFLCWSVSLFWMLLGRMGEASVALSATAFLASCVLGLATLVLTLRIVPISRNVSMKMLASFLAAGGTMLVLSDGHAASLHPAAPFVGALFVGIGGAWLSLCWAEHLGTFGARSTMVGMAVSGIPAALLSATLAAASEADFRILWILVAFPIASGVLLRPQAGARFFASSERRRDDVPRSAKELCVHIARDWSPRLLSVVSLTGFCFGATAFLAVRASSVQPVFLYFATFFGVAVASCLGCFAVLWKKGRAQGTVFTLLSVAIGLVSIGLVSGSLDARMLPLVSLALVFGGFGVVCLLVRMMMLERSYRRRLPVLGLLASLWLAGNVGILVGFAAAEVGFPNEVLMLDMLFAAAVGASLLLGSLGGKLVVSAVVMDPPEQSDAAVSSQALAVRYGLSEREKDVLEAWLKGYTAVSVGKLLHISKNTVKTHLKHIYQKTGVADKESLLLLSSRILDEQRRASAPYSHESS